MSAFHGLFDRGQSLNEQTGALVSRALVSGITYREAVREFRKCFIFAVLKGSGWNQLKAARKLEMHRNTLARTIAELRIDVPRPGARRPPRGQR